jgi:hypothetical protein
LNQPSVVQLRQDHVFGEYLYCPQDGLMGQRVKQTLEKLIDACSGFAVKIYALIELINEERFKMETMRQQLAAGTLEENSLETEEKELRLKILQKMQVNMPISQIDVDPMEQHCTLKFQLTKHGKFLDHATKFKHARAQFEAAIEAKKFKITDLFRVVMNDNFLGYVENAASPWLWCQALFPPVDP